MALYDFVALDFETATNYYNSACAIGIAAVKDGEIVDTFYSLIRPINLEFDPETIKVHGITPDMVKDSPTLDELWDKIRHFFLCNLVIAHNAYFDISVLKNSLFRAPEFNFKYIDSVSVARDFVPGSKSLAHCAEAFYICMGTHHNALDDAITCAKIVLCCLKESGASNIGQLCFMLDNVKFHSFDELDAQKAAIFHEYEKKTNIPAYSKINIKDIHPTGEPVSCEHPLYMKNIVFTGELTIDRKAAMQMAVDVGAVIKSGVSKKTNYLVVGKQDISIVGTDGISSKEEKALEINASGKAEIKIIGEEEFIQLIHFTCCGGAE